MKLLIELDEEYIKYIDKIRFLVGGRTYRKLQLEIIKAIKNGKALEQEPVIHAKWEKFCNKDGILRYLECSNCGQVSNQILLRYKYCPNCGAKMDKE